MRGFRHRCFFVLRDSGLQSLKDLAGRRVGTNGWPDSGNTWSRAALREQGVRIDEIKWWVGPTDDPAYDSLGHRPQLTLPSNVRYAAPGQTLQEMLLGEELDAMMCPWPPKAFHETGSQIVRLIPNYRQIEQDYARRIGFYPAHHIIALRRLVVERDPWVVPSLYQAFERSRIQAQENRRFLADTTPWLLADIEKTEEVLGAGWQANGVEPNLRMIETMCQEEFAQGLVAQPLDSRAVFAEFERLVIDAS
jgi:4,5-dihydroxyphthalate decarboxylase